MEEHQGVEKRTKEKKRSSYSQNDARSLALGSEIR